MNCEMVTFRAGILWGCQLIMSAHIGAPNVTGSDVPSTMSPIILQDKLRGERYAEQLDTLLLDYSKNRIDDNVLKALFELARERGVPEKIADMFSGKKINSTENRAVFI